MHRCCRPAVSAQVGRRSSRSAGIQQRARTDAATEFRSDRYAACTSPDGGSLLQWVRRHPRGALRRFIIGPTSACATKFRNVEQPERTFAVVIYAEVAAMHAPTSSRSAPSESSALIVSSRDTPGWPASILATRD